jgi:EAL domain-containing protein (putative c-di-GMP-specific phosphodiesterase class I)
VGPRLVHKLCFEVTETAAISDIVHASRFIGTLKARGCHFALDDFGSGFSSFAYLKNLPVDFVKIDGSFVREIAHDSIDLAMVRSINEIGHVMGKKTIAEFVEDRRILEVLRTVGVDYAQGYEIGRPQPIAEFALI